jgi:hypothetical protein
MMDDQIADAASSGNENGYAYRLFSWTKGVSTWTTGNKIRQDVEYWLVFTFEGRFMDFNIHKAHQTRYKDFYSLTYLKILFSFII